MKALILNSGVGKRMGRLTENKNKCMAEIAQNITIIDWQLQMLEKTGIKEVVITTGPFAENLEAYVRERYKDLSLVFRNNPLYAETNYIYSIALAKDLLEDDIVLMHGDLVFEEEVLKDIILSQDSVMVVDKSLPLPPKDFKAVIENGKIRKVGIGFFDNASAAQPLYKLNKADWQIWLENILLYCEQGNRSVYAENAMNEMTDKMELYPLEAEGRICMEVDNLEDLEKIRGLMKTIIQ